MRGRVSVQTSGNLASVIVPVEDLASPKSRKGLAMALNHTLAKTETQVNRALVRQSGLKYGAVKAAMKRFSGNAANLQGEIKGTGNHVPLKAFGARKTAKGVSAAPWNTRRVFPGTFFVQRYGGDVFRRTTDKRFPVKKLFGPAIPKEMVKDQAKVAFNKTVATELPKRVEHEMARLLGK